MNNVMDAQMMRTRIRRLYVMVAIALITPSLAIGAVAEGQAHKVRFLDAHVVSSIEGKTRPDDMNKFPDVGDSVDLYLVLKANVDGEVVYFSEAKGVSLHGADIEPAKLMPWLPQQYGDIEIRWYKVEPVDRYLSNTEGRWHWEEVRYAEILFGEGAWKAKADVNPSIFLTRASMGTMRYKVEVRLGRQLVTSPGAESRDKTGIKDNVHRISVKGETGVPLLDWAYSFMNLPYIWGSETPTGRPEDHQSERFIGADCADFVVAAARRAGYRLNYGNTYDLSPNAAAAYTEYVTKTPRLGRDGIYRDRDEKVVFGQAGVRPGDIVLFKRRHVGILVKDTAPVGYLSSGDIVLHTLWREPREEAIADAYPPPFAVVRLKDALLINK